MEPDPSVFAQLKFPRKSKGAL